MSADGLKLKNSEILFGMNKILSQNFLHCNIIPNVLNYALSVAEAVISVLALSE